MYDIQLTNQTVKDAKLLEQNGLKLKALELLGIIRENPYKNPPPYEKLLGVKDTYSRRINKQHRIVYLVLPNPAQNKDEFGNAFKGIIKVIRMWTHYE